MAKQMTPAEFAEACAMWESGEFTLADLSEKFGIRPEVLSRKFKKAGSKKGAKANEVKKAVEEELRNSTSDAIALTTKRAGETKEETYVWARAIGQHSMQLAAKARKDGTSVATLMEEFKALDRLMSIQQKVRAERYAALGLDKADVVDEGTLPELPITNLTEQEMDEIRSGAEAAAMGVGDGLGGTLENDVVEEGLGDDGCD